MGKALDITPAIKAKIIKSVDDPNFDTSKVSVFETVVLDTLPVSQRSMFNGATTTAQTLSEMAAFVNDGGFVPMHTLHEQGYELPVGRVFAGEVANNDAGIPELHGLFFVNNDFQDLAGRIDTGTINMVSVGLASQHLNCSVCGFDYLGADATPDNIWGQVCNEGHEIGVDGTHLIVSGLSKWMELSLVSQGASRNAKILSRTKSLMGPEAYATLAASGISPEATVFFTKVPLSLTKKPEQKMEIKELVQLNASLTGEKAVALHQVTTLKEAKTTLETQLTAANTEITGLKAQVAAIPADATKAVADLKLANDTLATQTAFFRKEADRLCVAAGVAVLADTASFADLTASIEANRVKLQAAFEGGNAQGSGAGSSTENKAKTTAPSAYKTA